jgi:hypothetical protein
MHARRLSAQEKRFEAYVRERGATFSVDKDLDCIIVFEHSHEGKLFTQTTLVTSFDVKNEETWEHHLDMLNGTFARALERHIRGVH